MTLTFANGVSSEIDKTKHIRHMFSNKTKDNISKRTKSLSEIQIISDVYNLESNVIKRSKHHKNKDADSDEAIIMEDLRKLKPFQHSANKIKNKSKHKKLMSGYCISRTRRLY